MNVTAIITLSSDEEEDEPKIKKPKLELEDSDNGTYYIIDDDNSNSSTEGELNRNAHEKDETKKIKNETDDVLNNIIIEKVESLNYSASPSVLNKNGGNPLNIQSNEEKKKDELNEHLETEDDIQIVEFKSNNDNNSNNSNDKIFAELLNVCKKTIENTAYEDRLNLRFKRINEKYRECKNLHNCAEFKKLLKRYIPKVKNQAAIAVHVFGIVYTHISENMQKYFTIDEAQIEKARKLEKFMRALIKKLKELDESEMTDFDNNSPYIQRSVFCIRLTKVYAKYCSILKINPNNGRPTYQKLIFSLSKYEEVNQAITKQHRQNKFPTYNDIEKCIRECVKKHQLPLTEEEIISESSFCFKKLGDILQLRRKTELYYDHKQILENCTDVDDPADEDPVLAEKLAKNKIEAQAKLDNLCETFVKKQEENVSVVLSEDSEDSLYKDSDTETEDCYIVKTS